MTFKGNVTIDAGPGLIFKGDVTAADPDKTTVNLTGPVIFSKDITAKSANGLWLSGDAHVFMEGTIHGKVVLDQLKESNLYGILAEDATVFVAKGSVASMELVNEVEKRALIGHGAIRVLGGTLKTSLDHPEYHGSVRLGRDGGIEIGGTPAAVLGDGELTLKRGTLKVDADADGSSLVLPNRVKLGVSPTIASNVGIIFAGDASVPSNALLTLLPYDSRNCPLMFGAGHQLAVAKEATLTITGEFSSVFVGSGFERVPAELTLSGSVAGHVVAEGWMIAENKPSLNVNLNGKLESGSVVELQSGSSCMGHRSLNGTGQILVARGSFRAEEALTSYEGALTVTAGDVFPGAGLGSKSRLVMMGGTIRGDRILFDNNVIFDGQFSIGAQDVTFNKAIEVNQPSLVRLWNLLDLDSCILRLYSGVTGPSVVTFQDDRPFGEAPTSLLYFRTLQPDKVKAEGNVQIKTGI